MAQCLISWDSRVLPCSPRAAQTLLDTEPSKKEEKRKAVEVQALINKWKNKYSDETRTWSSREQQNFLLQPIKFSSECCGCFKVHKRHFRNGLRGLVVRTKLQLCLFTSCQTALRQASKLLQSYFMVTTRERRGQLHNQHKCVWQSLDFWWIGLNISPFLFTCPAGGELLLWGQIPSVGEHQGPRKVCTPQSIPLAGGKVRTGQDRCL